MSITDDNFFLNNDFNRKERLPPTGLPRCGTSLCGRDFAMCANEIQLSLQISFFNATSAKKKQRAQSFCNVLIAIGSNGFNIRRTPKGLNMNRNDNNIDYNPVGVK
jgi:hypothetical protein